MYVRTIACLCTDELRFVEEERKVGLRDLCVCDPADRSSWFSVSYECIFFLFGFWAQRLRSGDL